MKICFHLQRSFARVGHAMAIQFNKKYGINEFCGLVSTRLSYNYLKNQKEIAYNKLILDEEIHDRYKTEKIDINYLKEMEQKYGIPFLWPYLIVDRVLMHGQLIREYPYDKAQYNHEELIRLMQVTLKEIVNFLETEKPDLIFFAVVNNMSSFLLYQIAKKKNIPVIFGELSRFPDSYMITDDYKRFHWTEEMWNKIKTGKMIIPEKEIESINKYIKDFFHAPLPYNKDDSPDRLPINRVRQLQFLLPKHWLKSLMGTFLMFKHFYLKSLHGYTSINPWHFIIDRIKRKTRMMVGFEDLYNKMEPKEDFAYFSLNLEPEIFLLLYAQHATNQLYYIQQVARSLPLDFKLYVKEHPAMVGYRPRSFYKELKKMPNVKLINPKIKSFELIKNAKLIITITGTAGWEALFFKKPTITFGYNFYNNLSMVKHCDNITELSNLIYQQLNNFRYNHEELVQFIAAIGFDTVPVNMVHLWYHEQNFSKIVSGVEPLVDLIAKKFIIS